MSEQGVRSHIFSDSAFKPQPDTSAETAMSLWRKPESPFRGLSERGNAGGERSWNKTSVAGKPRHRLAWDSAWLEIDPSLS